MLHFLFFCTWCICGHHEYLPRSILFSCLANIIQCNLLHGDAQTQTQKAANEHAIKFYTKCNAVLCLCGEKGRVILPKLAHAHPHTHKGKFITHQNKPPEMCQLICTLCCSRAHRHWRTHLVHGVYMDVIPVRMCHLALFPLHPRVDQWSLLCACVCVCVYVCMSVCVFMCVVED